MKCTLGISNFLEEISSLPVLSFPSNSLHWSLRKSCLPLLTVLWSSAFKWVYLSFSPLPLASLLSIAVCKASSDNHFAFLHFCFLGMILITASCTMSGTSIHSPSGTLSSRSDPLNPFVTSTEDLYYWYLFKEKPCSQVRSQNGLGQKNGFSYVKKAMHVWFFFLWTPGPFLLTLFLSVWTLSHLHCVDSLQP